MSRNFASTDRMTAGTSTILHVAAPITVALRYKVTSAPGNFLYLLSKERLSNEHSSYAFSTNGSGALTFAIGHGGSAGNVYVSPAVASVTAFTAGWHSAIGTYATADKVRLYVDGTEAGTGTTGGNAISYDGTKSLWFGVFDGTQLHYGTGASAGDRSLAEVAIWSVALDAAERAAYANGASPRLIRPTSLVAYWPLVGTQSPEPEIRNGVSATVTAAGTDEHPRVYSTAGRGLTMGDPTSAAGGPWNIAADRATETNASRAITSSKALAAGRSTETDAARAVAATRSYAVGRATETDAARGIVGIKAKVVGRATDTSAARTVTPTRLYPASRATETDAARAIAFTKALAVGRATETDAARPEGVTKTRANGRATETDAARAVAGLKTAPAGRVVETNVARAISASKAKAIGRAAETNVARALASAKSKAILRAGETDTSSQMAGTVPQTDKASEIDSARPLGAAKAKAVGRCAETELARPIGGLKQIAVTRAVTTDAAGALATLKTRALGRAPETDVARVAASSKIASVGRASETDAARVLTLVHAGATTEGYWGIEMGLV